MPALTRVRRRFILASASPRRKEILSRLGLPLIIDPSLAPEPDPRPGEPPARYALRLARFKARDVAGRHRSGLVIGADTVVVIGHEILGKPRTRREARGMLEHLRGRWHEVITGICLVDIRSGRTGASSARSRVRFRPLSGRELDWYLDTGEWRDKAGGYGIQGCGSVLVDRIEGCFFNIVGFPVVGFYRLCRRLGIGMIPAAESPARGKPR